MNPGPAPTPPPPPKPGKACRQDIVWTEAHASFNFQGSPSGNDWYHTHLGITAAKPTEVVIRLQDKTLDVHYDWVATIGRVRISDDWGEDSIECKVLFHSPRVVELTSPTALTHLHVVVTSEGWGWETTGTRLNRGFFQLSPQPIRQVQSHDFTLQEYDYYQGKVANLTTYLTGPDTPTIRFPIGTGHNVPKYGLKYTIEAVVWTVGTLKLVPALLDSPGDLGLPQLFAEGSDPATQEHEDWEHVERS